jgi:hypothetical protein
LIEIWKIPTIESEIFFLILSNLDNSKLLEILTLLQLFNDGKFSCVDKRHPYELDEKTAQKGLWMKKKCMVTKCIESASTHNEAKTSF